MTNFKEHWLIFKMLEEPVPLTADAELPCLVRLIQDDSRMGMFNRDTKPSRLSDFYLAARIVNNNIIVDEFMESDYHRFEIIGYPVADGSKDWALYQMMKGKKVCNPTLAAEKATRFGYDDAERFNIFWYIVGDTVVEGKGNYGTLSVSSWIAAASSSGWKIYKEPKPEPIFTTGDKVTDGVIEGTIIHIEDAIADVCPSTDEYKIELRNLNHIPESPKQDDVEKPLRSMIAEAKAIGKNIRTYYQDIVFTPQALEACLNQGKFRWWNICNWELTTREQNYFPSISTSSDRPKEEPKLPKEQKIDSGEKEYTCLVCGKKMSGLDGRAEVSIKRISISSLYESTLSHYCGKCFLELGFDKTEKELRSRQQPQPAKKPIANCENCKHVCTNSNIDHCHMYEPKPESENIIHGHIPADMRPEYFHLCKFKVGDWVECNGNQHLIESISRDLGGSNHYHFAHGFGGAYAKSITRKLKPSEIIVRIGCLSGTIAKSCNPNYFLMLHSRPMTDCNHSVIKFSALDIPTGKLVESLLKAMRGES